MLRGQYSKGDIVTIDFRVPMYYGGTLEATTENYQTVLRRERLNLSGAAATVLDLLYDLFERGLIMGCVVEGMQMRFKLPRTHENPAPFGPFKQAFEEWSGSPLEVTWD